MTRVDQTFLARRKLGSRLSFTFTLIRLVAVAACISVVDAEAPKFTQFEARQTHSIAITPDGTRLLALNSPAATLAIFDISVAEATPTLLAEIPVGLEPVAVAARTGDEVWVVNEVSDSVSIVSLSRKTVVATLPASDEPADIIFAQGKAFVTCARNGLIRVFDAVSRAPLSSIPLRGLDPRALASDATGSYIFAAFLHSGNATTVLSRTDAPAQPTPTNPALPEAPNTALIVAGNDARIAHGVLDRDVAMIDAASGQVTKYLGGLGTTLFALCVHPLTGDLWVANTEALNLVRFEPNLSGHFLDHRLTCVNSGDGSTSILDLNAGMDYGTLPNPTAQTGALSQPTAIAIQPDGKAWVAAFASDRLAKIDLGTGEVLVRIDIRTNGGNSAVMRGPRAVVLHPTAPRLYVLNKVSDSISVIDTSGDTVLAELPLPGRDTMPGGLRHGRGFLFDARLSGNGTASCAGCHVDADRDGLAWDLGNPGGDMVTVLGANLVVHDPTLRPRVIHPMKGPMVTQTLRGMQSGAPFHWRGDRPTLQSFNPTFERLMGGSELPSADIDALAEYLLSLRNHPNPNRTKTGALPNSFAGGNPARGEMLFNLHDNHCGICHLAPKGTDNNIDLHQDVGAAQPIKNPPLGTVYQRVFFDSRPGSSSLSGFGLLHDGTGSGLSLPTVHPYVLDQLVTSADFLDVQAFVLCFDTGTSPAVGDSVTLTSQTIGSSNEVLNRLEFLLPATAQVVVHATIAGVQHRFIYSRSLQIYVPEDLAMPPLTRQQLLALLSEDDSMTFLAVPPLEGGRFAGTRSRHAEATPDSYFVKSAKAVLSISAAQGVMANDSSVAATHDVAAVVVESTAGVASLNTDGSITYTPGAAFSPLGFDRFAYEVLIAADPGNATEPVPVTISTFASIAGQYMGVLKADADQRISGFLTITVSSNGSWTGSIRVGPLAFPVKGTLGVDGVLQLKRSVAADVNLRLSRLVTGEREVSAKVVVQDETFTGTAQPSPYSKASPAPNPGKHGLILTPTTVMGTAPMELGSARLKLTASGTVVLMGRLGDGTSFSLRGVVAPRPGGGWQFTLYLPLYKSPPGDLSGILEFDPGVSVGVGGALTLTKPPQTRPGPFQSGFSVNYTATESSPP